MLTETDDRGDSRLFGYFPQLLPVADRSADLSCELVEDLHLKKAAVFHAIQCSMGIAKQAWRLGPAVQVDHGGLSVAVSAWPEFGAQRPGADAFHIRFPDDAPVIINVVPDQVDNATR